MKKVLFFFALSLFVFSCEKDDEFIADLYHDNGLNAAPFLLPGEYMAAARYTANEMSEFQGKTLQGIEFYLESTPTQCEVRVYSGSNGDAPGTLIYSKSVTVDVEANSWNLHSPDTPVEITGEDLWIAIRLVLNSEEATIGCDVGPAVSNGDLFFSLEDNAWTTYRAYTNPQVSINWNIRGHVSD